MRVFISLYHDNSHEIQAIDDAGYFLDDFELGIHRGPPEVLETITDTSDEFFNFEKAAELICAYHNLKLVSSESGSDWSEATGAVTWVIEVDRLSYAE